MILAEIYTGYGLVNVKELLDGCIKSVFLTGSTLV